MAKQITHNQRRKFERAMEFGADSLDFGDARTALSYFKRAKAICCSNFSVHFGIARCLHDLRQFQKSISRLYIALLIAEDSDDVAWVCFYIGKNLLSLERYDEAKENFDQALSLSPNLIHAYIAKAFVYSAQQKHTEAYLSAEFAVTHHPEIAAAHHALGVAYIGLGEHKKAIDSLKVATTLAPEYPIPYYLLGRMYSEQGRWGLAEEAYTEWLALCPELPEAKEKMSMAVSKLAELQ